MASGGQDHHRSPGEVSESTRPHGRGQAVLLSGRPEPRTREEPGKPLCKAQKRLWARRGTFHVGLDRKPEARTWGPAWSSIIDLLGHPEKVTRPLWAHVCTTYHQALLTWGLCSQKEGGAVDPRRVSNMQSLWESPDAVLGGERLGDRPPPSRHTPPAPTPHQCEGHHGRRARDAPWVVGSGWGDMAFYPSPEQTEGQVSFGLAAPPPAFWRRDPGQVASRQ